MVTNQYDFLLLHENDIFVRRGKGEFRKNDVKRQPEYDNLILFQSKDGK